MESLVQTGKYGSINAADLTTIGYYVVKYVSYTFTLEEYITTDGKVSRADEMLVRK